MYKYVIAKGSEVNFSLDGSNLYFFLKTYFSKSELCFIDLKKVRNEKIRTANLLICLPSNLTKDDLKDVYYERLALFDYFDEPHLLANERITPFFGLTKKYLKTSRVLDFGLQTAFEVGLLPILLKRRIPSKISMTANSIVRNWNYENVDVAFMGSNTYLRRDNSKDYLDAENNYYQRIEWLLEILDLPEIEFFGWLNDIYHQKEFSEKIFGRALPFLCNRKISFKQFFYILSNSKIALAPAGHARWTYRHIEGIYAKSVIISNDIRNLETLIPMPLNQMVIIKDHEAVGPKVAQVLKDFDDYADWTESNLQFMDRYLTRGLYDRKKPFLLERFEKELIDA